MLRRLLALVTVPSALLAQGADLIVTASHIWTGDSTRPRVQALAVANGRILVAGTRAEAMRLRTPRTRLMELGGRFIAPGFIDNHTHFERAGALITGVNLLDVSDETGLARRVREARDRLPRGAWLVGGEWGAYEAFEMGSTGAAGRERRATFNPSRDDIDSLTRESPAILNKWDRSAFLANSRAIELARADCSWPGVECVSGRPTGRMNAAAAGRVTAVIPSKALDQRLVESRAGMRHLNALGVTSIHDITSPDQMGVFQEMKKRGELTLRVYARPTLDKVEHLRAVGIRHGYGDEWIRIGGLKGFVDGIMGNSSARFYEPYLTTGELGAWRVMMEPAGNMERLLFIADSAGHWPQVHAIGDFAIDTLLTLFETVMRTNGSKERRWRLIHTQVLRNADVARRMARLGIIAEVQPYHAIDDMRWMEPRIGERSRWAYAFKTLEDAGVLLSFGSDWPGTNAAWYTASPLLGMYAAVTRQTLDGKPAEGWFSMERVTLNTAMRAYTANNAWAANEETLKGKLTPGFLADFVVVDRDPFDGPPSNLRDRRILLTVIGGKVVFDAARDPAAVDPARRMIQ
ncbi:MAG: amidohydrolase [Gemmatimonadaceae bacterium]